MAELKPCPFCGGEADCNNSGFMKAGKHMWAVECLKCGMVTTFADTEKEAIEAWNKRTEPERPKGRWIPVTERLPEKDGKHREVIAFAEEYEEYQLGWLAETEYGSTGVVCA